MSDVRNARIKSAVLSTGDHNILTAVLMLDYGDGSVQGFGNYHLSATSPKSKRWMIEKNYAGVFIVRTMQVAGVSEWADLVGKIIRVQTRPHFGAIQGIGHAINDDWFFPHDIFETMEKSE